MNHGNRSIDLDEVGSLVKTLFVFLILFVFLYFFKLGGYGLIDVDEPRYAEAAREMIESKNWTVPYFNYVVRYDKPILFYWLEAIAMLVFGINEFSARLPSVLMSFFCLYFVYLFIRKFSSLTIALLGVLVLMTSFEFAALSRFSIPDMTLSAFITASIICFYLGYCELLESGRFYKNQIVTFSFWYILGFIFTALAFLTKGPVVLVLEFLIFFPFFWWIRKLDYFFKNKSFWIGFIGFIVLTLPWYISVHNATGGEFTKVFFGLHNFARFTTVVSGHKGVIYFYIPVVLLGFMPWIFFLPQSIYCVVKKGLTSLLKGSQEQVAWFCLWWFLVVFLFFSFSRTQLLTYILSSFPALAIIVT
ncbi:MAG: glycosyltransferase family 39 protein, partial [Candidatus Melainabacteria bacterium]|nr:glycosyltransferase family 39 protein [Candidatus Melainabacteria bacterium]